MPRLPRLPVAMVMPVAEANVRAVAVAVANVRAVPAAGVGQSWPTGPIYSLYTAYIQPIYIQPIGCIEALWARAGPGAQGQ